MGGCGARANVRTCGVRTWRTPRRACQEQGRVARACSHLTCIMHTLEPFQTAPTRAERLELARLTATAFLVSEAESIMAALRVWCWGCCELKKARRLRRLGCASTGVCVLNDLPRAPSPYPLRPKPPPVRRILLFPLLAIWFALTVENAL